MEGVLQHGCKAHIKEHTRSISVCVCGGNASGFSYLIDDMEKGIENVFLSIGLQNI